ncbi:MAG: hypothetical protein V1916_01270 [Patescibacteria group bacterium]
MVGQRRWRGMPIVGLGPNDVTGDTALVTTVQKPFNVSVPLAEMFPNEFSDAGSRDPAAEAEVIARYPPRRAEPST